MKIAFVGDIHGKIDQMYKLVSQIEIAFDFKIDKIIQVGDFHAIRDEKDLRSFPAPKKYKSLGDFPFYYRKGEVPRETYFVGGNHENYLWHSKFPNGHELINNLYYLGRSGIKDFGGIKIGWVSGNYSKKAFYGENKRKNRHFTEEDLNRLVNLREKPEVLIFHEWPSIRRLVKNLVRWRDSGEDILQLCLKRGYGSEELYDIIERLKPRYVFAGHLHRSLDLETLIDDSETRFIALDKLRPDKNKIYVLDSNDLTITRYTLESGNLEDIFNKKSGSTLKQAFNYLEEDRFNEARGLLEEMLSENDPSIRSLVNYGLGLSFLKEAVEENKESETKGYESLKKSVRHFEESLRGISHADAHLMLGLSLFLLLDNKAANKNEESGLEKRINKIIPSFQKALKLNPSYKIFVEEIMKKYNLNME